MTQTLFFLILAFSTCPGLLHAQTEAEVPPPTAPFVLPPPAQAAWTIKVMRPAVAKDPQNAKAAQKQRVVIAIASVQSNESKRDVVSYSDGSKREIWFAGNYMLWPYPDGSRAGVSSVGSEVQLPEPVESPHFPGLDWLSADSYKDVEKKGSQQCRHYVKAGEGDRWEAWINLESGLPVAAKFGDVTHTYAFTTPLDAPLQMPAIYAQALASVTGQAARTAAIAENMPPKPPFVRPPPAQSAWTIKVIRPTVAEDPQNAKDAQKQRVVVAIASVHYGESKRDVVYYSDGFKREIWFVGNYMFWPYPDGSRVGVSSADSEVQLPEPVESPRFPGLDWLSANTYKGVEKIGDVTCRHYVKGGEGDSWEAWIGLESGLPVASKFRSVGHLYTFTDPPAAPLQMPPMYAKALEEAKKRAARAAALAEKFRRR